MKYLTVSLALAITTSAGYGADNTDTPAASQTRANRLKGKVSLEVKDETLKNVLTAFADQIEDQKLGRFGLTFATGVTPSDKVTVSVKDKPLAKALEDVLKPAGLGYVVVSKAGDRGDGWLKITKGNERGYEAGREPPTADANPDDPDEQAAAEKLEAAKKYIADNKPADAKVMLNYVLKKFPKTKAAAEAKELAGTIGK